MLLLLIAILLVLNALFVMAEMAMISARKSRLQARADRGDPGAKAALDLIDRPNTFLSTVQIGITLISILMGAFGETAIADKLVVRFEEYEHLRPYARYISIGITVVLLTYASLIFAELVPKRIARASPEAISSLVALPMKFISRLGAPLVWLLSISTDIVLKFVPLRATDDHDSTEAEVKALLATGTEAGVFHEEEQQLVERVFRLSDQRITALMVPHTDIDFLHTDDTIQRVRVVLATSNHSHYPVCTPGKGLDGLVGVVHVKELVHAGIVSDTIDLGAIAKPPVYVPESTPAIKVLDQFRSGAGSWRSHLAFVINEYGSILGMVTHNDLLQAIVGQAQAAPRATNSTGAPSSTAQDTDPAIVRRPDGSFLVDGMLPVADLKELMGVSSLPREDEAGYDTLAGFVLSFLGHIPATGDSFELTAADVGLPDVADFAPSEAPSNSQASDIEGPQPVDASREPQSDQPFTPPLSDDAISRSASKRRPVLFTFEVMDMDRTRVDKVLLTIAPGFAEAVGGSGEGV